MKLYIKSQDGLWIGVVDNVFADGLKIQTIISNEYKTLGKYKTQNSVKEVLNEISNKFKNMSLFRILGSGTLKPEALNLRKNAVKKELGTIYPIITNEVQVIQKESDYYEMP